MVHRYKGFPDDSRIVSVNDASGLVGKEGVVFVDTRNYWKYADGHIPGAVNLELYAFHWIDTSEEGLKAFSRQMAGLFGAFGIDNHKQVVFYQNNSGYDAARGVWLLEWLGSKRARMLDGGLNAWKREGLPLSEKDSELPRTRFAARPDRSVISTIGELKSSESDKDEVLDVRSAGEFDGTHKRAAKAGHIPGAVNIEWKKAVRRDGTLKSATQLKALYKGVSPSAGVVTYCQSGYRAAHSWLVLKSLGFENVKNYIGSWYEWGSDPETKVATGKG